MSRDPRDFIGVWKEDPRTDPRDDLFSAGLTWDTVPVRRSVTMKTIGAAEFKAHCLEILDHVDPDGIVITKRGKPVAKLVPVRDDVWERFYGIWGGNARVDPDDDLLSTGVVWEAEEGKLDGEVLPILHPQADQPE